jgi:6-phosphofructokinase 1
LQQGGDPSPFDRIQATRLARLCVDFLIEQCEAGGNRHAFIGTKGGQTHFYDLTDFARMVNLERQRPKDQWWMDLRPIAKLLAQSGPSWEKE